MNINTTLAWIPQTDNQLVATLPISTEEEVTQYRSLLQRWLSLAHPTILELEQTEINRSEKHLEVTIVVKKFQDFEPCQPKLVTLTTFEKLWIFRQTLDLHSYIQPQGWKLSWSTSELYLNRTVHCGWLPPLPGGEAESGQGKERLMRFLLTLFDLEITEITRWPDLQKSGKLPWEWGAFIEYYLATPEEDPNVFNVFAFLFYQAWLYATANRLSLKDKILTKQDYQTLYQFGKNLGLTDVQIQQLNVIAQQQTPDWKDLVSLSEANIK